MRVATWNVNSVNARLGHVVEWLGAAAPDVLCLQETKCTAEAFPRLPLQALGYTAEVVGQKAYNGVAILSREPLEDVVYGLPGAPEDEQARYVEATVRGVRIASIYLPNGNPVGTEKYPYKLAWMARLRARAEALLAAERPVVLAGDYNVCPTDDDVYDPVGWRDDALCRPESRREWRALLNLGYTDALRALAPDGHHYTFWDYQQGRWPRREGLRIDHFALSPHATDRLLACAVDETPRHKAQPSDHTVVVCELSD